MSSWPSTSVPTRNSSPVRRLKTSSGTGVEGSRSRSETARLNNHRRPGTLQQTLPFGWFGTVTPSKEASLQPFEPDVYSHRRQPGKSEFHPYSDRTTSLVRANRRSIRRHEHLGHLPRLNKGRHHGYTITVIEGSAWFSVTPSSGSSSGLSDKQLHTVTVDHTEIRQEKRGPARLKSLPMTARSFTSR